jgi:hypothetical protein
VAELGGDDPDTWLAEHAAGWRAGTPDVIVTWLHRYEAAGLDHAMLMVAPHADVAQIDLLARDVLPQSGTVRTPRTPATMTQRETPASDPR